MRLLPCDLGVLARAYSFETNTNDQPKSAADHGQSTAPTVSMVAIGSKIRETCNGKRGQKPGNLGIILNSLRPGYIYKYKQDLLWANFWVVRSSKAD